MKKITLIFALLVLTFLLVIPAAAGYGSDEGGVGPGTGSCTPTGTGSQNSYGPGPGTGTSVSSGPGPVAGTAVSQGPGPVTGTAISQGPGPIAGTSVSQGPGPGSGPAIAKQQKGSPGKFTLSGTITGIGTDNVTIEVFRGSKVVKPYLSTELLIYVTASTRYLMKEASIVVPIEFEDLEVGQLVSVNGTLASDTWTALRITVGASLIHLP